MLVLSGIKHGKGLATTGKFVLHGTFQSQSWRSMRAIHGQANVAATLGKGENVNTDVLVRICKALDCDLPDIVELKKESK